MVLTLPGWVFKEGFETFVPSKMKKKPTCLDIKTACKKCPLHVE